MHLLQPLCKVSLSSSECGWESFGDGVTTLHVAVGRVAMWDARASNQVLHPQQPHRRSHVYGDDADGDRVDADDGIAVNSEQIPKLWYRQILGSTEVLASSSSSSSSSPSKSCLQPSASDTNKATKSGAIIGSHQDEDDLEFDNRDELLEVTKIDKTSAESSSSSRIVFASDEVQVDDFSLESISYDQVCLIHFNIYFQHHSLISKA
jgi:hypothetical protein